MSTGVGPRSLTRSQVENPRPRPTPPSRVNGLLVLLWPEAPCRSSSRLSSGSATRSDRSRATVPFETAPARGDEELLPCHRPTRHSACPQSSPMSIRAPFETRHRERRERLRSRNHPPPVACPCRGDRCARAPSDPCGSALTRPSRSPPSRATPAPPSSSDDCRNWVVPGISSGDPGLAARCLSPSTREGAGAPPRSPTGEPAGGRLFHTLFHPPVTGSSFRRCSVQGAALPFPQRLDGFCD